MSMNSILQKAKSNKARLRIHLTRIVHFLTILAFICSLVGINPHAVQAAPSLTPACSTGVFPCSVWGTGGVPSNANARDDSHTIDLGMKFRSDVDGYIKGLRFYKGSAVTGTHTGQLWSSVGTKLAEAVFEEEGTGWQEVFFGSPVAITANTTYIASYYSSDGYFAYSAGAFSSAGVDSGNLHVLQNGVDGPNSVYVYDLNGFPTNAGGGSNYWADVLFDVSLVDTTPPSVAAVSPANQSFGVPVTSVISASFSEALDQTTLDSSKFELRSGGILVPAALSYSAGTAVLTPVEPLAYAAVYTATVKAGLKDLAGNPSTTDFSWTFNTVITPACTTGLSPCSIWGSSGMPELLNLHESAPLEMGMKFKSAVDGLVMGVRYYKGPQDNGANVGHLWKSDGSLLAGASFGTVSGSGWQEVTFDTPVLITAGATYIVSVYSSNNYYVDTRNFFTSTVNSYPLQALQNVDGSDPNGVYANCSVTTGCFWNTSYQASNYWVDVVFTAGSFTPVLDHFTVDSISSPQYAGIPFNLAISARDSLGGVLASYTGPMQLSVSAGTMSPSVTGSFVNGSWTGAVTLPQAGSGFTITATDPSSGKMVSTNAITVSADPNCPCSLWPSNPTPANPSVNDDTYAAELGVKFRSDIAGYVTGVRFYKGVHNTGIHTGSLWSFNGTTGVNLGTLTFTNESATGWQTGYFDTPIQIDANKTYIVSYLAPDGGYALDRPYFTGTGVDLPPLHALRSGVDGPNAVFSYLPPHGSGGFFDLTYQDSNYWVDLVFDNAPAPSVIASSPVNGAGSVRVDAKITAAFNVAVNPATVLDTTFVLTDGSGPVPAVVTYNAVSHVASLSASLAYATTYTATVTTGVHNLLGNPLAAPYSWTFTTRATPHVPVPNMKAVVLVNSTSPNYADFQHFIKPYLDNFGIPYDVQNITSSPVGPEISDYALIIIGHRSINASSALDTDAQDYITAAVKAGTGLVNFDNLLSNGTTPTLQFVQDLFGFTYDASTHSASGVAFNASHYITQRHSTDTAAIGTGTMSLAGINAATDAARLAWSGSTNNWFLSVSSQYRAVQFGTYDWMSVAVKGPVFGLDDTVWRSLVWAARKPFAMQGIPPFATFRIDDVSGPLDWVHIANEVGFKPWLGIFTDDFIANPDRITDLRGMINSGSATASLHAFGSGTFTYFDQFGTLTNGTPANFPDSVVGQNFITATDWFTTNQIPIAKFVLGHYYGTGSNIFGPLDGFPSSGLLNWGVQFVGLPQVPGTNGTSSPWLQEGPYRLYETGNAGTNGIPHYYADYLSIPGHPELDGKIFNCFSEIRDIQGYDWLPTSSDLPGSISTGTQWFTRSFNSMTLATLFLHEYARQNIVSSASDWRTIMQGIASNISPYHPRYVTLDYACQYLRATHDSNIVNGIYDSGSQSVTVDLSGKTDMPTQFYLFTQDGTNIRQAFIDVPTFDGTTHVTAPVPGALDHLVVTPASPSVVGGTTRQFTAQAFDSGGNPINDPDLVFTWSITNGGGTIDANGLFTAGLVGGTYSDTVTASVNGLSAHASVTVTIPQLDHFTIDPVASPEYAGIPIQLSITARDASGNVVFTYAGSMTLSDSTGTLAPASTGTFVGGRWTGLVTIDHVGSGVTITASDLLAGKNVTSTAFTVSPTPGCPCSLWPANPTPGTTNVGDLFAVELGIKFRSDIPGYITGLRFYKGANNTGTHTGHLWSFNGTTGSVLGTLTFTNETAVGWQTAYFETPILIEPNTTYIASYLAPHGGYADDNDYFASSGVDTPPLHALRNGVDGVNAPYVYQPPEGTGGFPDQSYRSSNYWVDVLFDTQVGPDTTPPFVLSTSPASAAGAVSINTVVTAAFNEALDSSTLDAASFELRDSEGGLVPAGVSYSSTTHIASLVPTNPLAYSTTYSAAVKAGIKDLAGNATTSAYTWSFTTSSPPPPPPDTGPGGPILVIASSSNPFGKYYAEILRTEGLNEFAVHDITAVTPALLSGYKLVILGEMSLTPGQVGMLADWVNAGGSLVAMRPDKTQAGLLDLLGLADASGTLSNAYLKVENTGPGAGIVSQAIQFHGTADRFTLDGATALAFLYSNDVTPTVYPAVTIRSVGSNGGVAAAFTYDLARSVVYTRQGNPAWSGQERDGVAPIRSDDLFYGNSSTDPQPDWIDLSKVAIPQADEQQRLLANIILDAASTQMPLPRFWYFPNNGKAVVVMTSDVHGDAYAAGRMDLLKSVSPAGCSLTDWSCIRSSIYLYTGSTFKNAQALAYTNDGFEIALHVNTNCADWTPSSLAAMFTSQMAGFTSALPGAGSPSTERTHCIAWSDWASQPKVELANGIRLDTNYYYWPDSWVLNRPGMFTGSGMVMRFADLDGAMIDVYQAATQMTDESGQSFPGTINALLDKALGPEGYYGVFTANMHGDSLTSEGSDAVIASALAHGVPVVSARQMLTWVDGRNGSSFANLVWSNDQLAFTISVGVGAGGLQAMLPARSGDLFLAGLTAGALPVAYTLTTIKGVEYAVFAAHAGNFQASYAPHTTPPVISSLSLTPGSGGTALLSWITDEPSTSHVEYGTSPSDLSLGLSNPALVASHSFTLSGLLPGGTYYYRVSSVDGFDNGTVFPALPASPLSFTMPAGSLSDTAVADFSAGNFGACYPSKTADGEISLAPTTASEFNGTALPSGWTNVTYSGGSSLTMDGNSAVLNSGYLASDAYFGPGRVLEFVATFTSVPVNNQGQHIGFGTDFNGAPWAIFSTSYPGSSTLRIRTNTGTDVSSDLGSGYFDVPHRYRIVWLADGVDYYIDGVLVGHHAVAIAANMRPLASDSSLDAGPLSLDWMRMSPYLSPCTFTSRVFDAGQVAHWLDLSDVSTIPSGTSLGFETRTSIDNLSWSSWQANTGPIISPNGRYIQYRASLATADSNFTPVMESVMLSYTTLETPLITWADPANIVYGTALSAVQLNAAASVPGTFAYTPALSALLDAGSQTLHVDFVPSDLEKYALASRDIVLVVEPKAVTITAESKSKTYGDENPPLTASVVGAVEAGDVVNYSLSTTASRDSNAGIYPIAVTIGSNLNYIVTPHAGTLVVNKASAALSLGGLSQYYQSGTARDVTVATVPAGLSTSVTYDPSGHTDPGVYAVTASVTDPNYTGSVSGTLTILAEHQVTLQSGWNLVSFNVHPLDTRVITVLASIAGKYDLVYTWDNTGASHDSGNWKKYAPWAPSYQNTLDALDETTAFWIHMTTGAVLSVDGFWPTSPTLSLLTNSSTNGWNLAGCPTTRSDLSPAVVLSTVSPDYSLIYAYHAIDADHWKVFDPAAPGFANDLKFMQPGWGYWIKVSVDHPNVLITY